MLAPPCHAFVQARHIQRLRVLAASNRKEILKRLGAAARRHKLVVASTTQDVLTQLIESALNFQMDQVRK